MSQKKFKYIDPLNDFAFKRLFGIEQNKDLLMAFLNEVFKGRKHIVDLVYNNNEHLGELQEIGATVFDITCTGDQGEKFIIEIQRSKQENFKDRVLYYTSRAINDQVPKGNRNEWSYELKGVYMVAILDKFTLDGIISSKYLHNVALCDVETGKIFYNKLGHTYIELRNFDKKDSELETDLDNWIYVLKNLSKMEQQPAHLSKPIFKKLFNIAEYSNLTRDEKEAYDRSVKYIRDNENARKFAIKTAKMEGLQKGRQEVRYEVAKEMKNKGVSISLITEYTKLSTLEIEEL